MEKEIAFRVLEIPETKDEDAIREAYHLILQHTNPEDDPQGFQRLREAYEVGIQYAREQEEEKKEKPETEVDLWMDRMDRLYQDIPSRHRGELWSKLLSEPICDALDTAIEIREKMLVYLMNHIHLPHSIWVLIDDALEITSDLEELSQQFPVNFLRYVQYYVENDTFIPYELFEYTGSDGTHAKPDEYIDGLLAAKKQLDAGEWDQRLQELDDLSAFGVYHPFEDVERLRYYTMKRASLQKEIAGDELEKGDEKQDLAGLIQLSNDCDEHCRSLIDSLSARAEKYNYISIYIGEALWELGQKEQAHSMWSAVLEREPGYYQARYGVARYLMEQKDYYEARELMEQLLDVDGQDEKVQKMLQSANGFLIQKYKKELELGEEDEHFQGDELVLELGWCLFQNDEIDEAIRTVESLSPETEQEYGYYNLYGRLLYQKQEYEKAIPILEHWKGMLWDLEDDGTEEIQRRIAKKNMACGILGACYHEVGRKEDAVDSVKQAIAVAQDLREKLGSMQQLAAIKLERKEYEETIDICDEIIRQDDQYYPAFLLRQEACYELKKGQDVVDDYYRAIEIYPGYFRPYMFAAEVFFFFGQYEDGMKVLERARENGVTLTPRMRLYEAKLIRNLSHSEMERKRAFEILDELTEQVDEEECDLEDPSELLYERALLHWDNNNLNKAYLYITRAKKMNPDRAQYIVTCGNIQVDREKYREALQEFHNVKEEYGDSPGYFYDIGACYEGMGDYEKAVACYEHVLSLQNTYGDTCERLSDYYSRRYHRTYHREYLDKALSYVSRQLEETENCYFLVSRGLLYMNAMDVEHAMQDFKNALKYREDDWPSWNNLGCCYKYLGEFEEAIRCFEKAVSNLREDKDILPYSNMADCYEALGEYKKAIDCYQKDLEIDPTRLSLWEEMGDLYVKLTEYDKARAAYQKGQVDTNSHIGETWILQGDIRKGISFYKKGIQAAERYEKARKSRELGVLYVDVLLDYHKGIKYLRKAKNYSERYIEWMKCEQYIAKAYYMMGDKKKAKQHAQLALNHFKEDPYADAEKGNMTEEEYTEYAPYAPIHQAEFGWIYLCLGEEEKAKEYFERMGQRLRCRHCRYKKCFESTLYLGDMLRLQGNTQGAREAYEETLRRNPHCEEAKAGLTLL